jgi:hypothetical protein
MPILRIDQQPGSGPGKHRIAVNAEVPGLQPLSFSREIEFALSPSEAERIRWYLEDLAATGCWRPAQDHISSSTRTLRRRSRGASRR